MCLLPLCDLNTSRRIAQPDPAVNGSDVLCLIVGGACLGWARYGCQTLAGVGGSEPAVDENAAGVGRSESAGRSHGRFRD